MKKLKWNLLASFLILAFAAGCAASYSEGVNAQGEKVYLGSVPIQKSEAYQTYLSSKHTAVDKQRYLFQRLRAADDLQFFHNGSWYSALDAYRGGMWLMREKYKAGQDTREFIKKYVERSEDTGQLHLAKYPDGSLQVGSYILFNELDLLEATAKKDLKE
ncbi:MAG TPA: hypothetical protein VJC08_03900 [bacterium]|nr:MAG: hypothetical protein A2Z83_08005 [Omnitrophica bacterium GWA2_52_8]HLD50319.1 hypothetical protein [bacterium]